MITAIQAMRSRTILEHVVDEVGVDAILRGTLEGDRRSGGILSGFKAIVSGLCSVFDPSEPREKAIRLLEEEIDIEAERGSSVLKVSYRTKSPQMARLVADAWTKHCRNEYAKMHSHPGSLEFFESQERELLHALEEARYKLRAKKSEYGLVTIVGQQEFIQSQIQVMTAALLEARSQYAAAQARVKTYEQAFRSTSDKITTSKATADSSESIDRMRDRLFALEIEEKELASRFKSEHPTYLAAKAQLDEARRVYDSQKPSKEETIEGINPAHVTLNEMMTAAMADRDAYKAKVEETESSLAKLDVSRFQINQQEADLAAIQRSVDALEARYRIHFEKHEQARFAAQLEQNHVSSISVIQPASFVQRPASPNIKLCVVLGLMGSLLLATGYCILLEVDRQPGQAMVMATRPVSRSFESYPANHQKIAQDRSEAASATQTSLVLQ